MMKIYLKKNYLLYQFQYYILFYNPIILKIINNQTDEMCMEVVKQCEYSLQYVHILFFKKSQNGYLTMFPNFSFSRADSNIYLRIKILLKIIA